MGVEMARVVLSARDWGPVSTAQIVIKPLTVFIGPNNTGKSYMAMLYYGLVRALDAALYQAQAASIMRDEYRRLSNKLTDKINELARDRLGEKRIYLYPHMLLRLRSRGLKEFDEVLHEAVEGVIDDIAELTAKTVEDELRRIVVRELERVYSANLTNLIRKGSSSAVVELDFETRGLHGKLSLRVNSGGRIAVDFELSVLDRKLLVRELIDKLVDRSIWRLIFRRRLEPPLDMVVDMVVDGLRGYLASSRLVYRRVHYFPASRAGILQGYRALAGALVSLAPLAAIRGVEVPGLPGSVADFLAGLIEISPAEEVKEGLARHLEELLEGRVRIARSEPGAPPALIYEQAGLTIQLTGASSMVGELAPLLLYLKYGLVEPGDALIIEEPEAHLHPDKQAKLAELLAKLVNESKLTILVTTHSDMLLARLSNLVSLSALPAKEIEKLGYDPSTTLKPNQVAVYSFERNGGGVVVEPVDVTEEGIPDDVFREVVEQLYHETMTIYYKLQELKGSGAANS